MGFNTQNLSRLKDARNVCELSIDRIKRHEYLILEYEKIKLGEHPEIDKVYDFYKSHNLDPKNFLKYYNRYRQSHLDKLALLPQQRGPRFSTRRPDPAIENQVLSLRLQGFNRYEIHVKLKAKLKDRTPSYSGIYNIFKRHNLNRLNKAMKQEKKQKMIHNYPGEVGHIDCHYLPKTLISGEIKKRYLVAVIDSYSRVAYAEIINDTKSLTVMFATMRILHIFDELHNIKFERVISDNGSEFGGFKATENRAQNPFCRLLDEMGIKHTKTKPYKPQTNGKIERYWRTIHDELIDADFNSMQEFLDHFADYMVYYNHERIHQAIDNKTPVQMLSD